MTQIKQTFGEGGANVVPNGSQGEPTLAETLRDIADDLSGIQITACVSPASVDLATVIVLAEELRTKVDAIAAVVLKTEKI